MNALKILVMSVLAVTISACQPVTSNGTNSFNLPSDLKHCEVVTMYSGGISSDRIYLIKCPEGTVPDGYIGTSSSRMKGKTVSNTTSIVI
jgi:hypothetical protein